MTGILTFHWAANYGAVLQAYALQEFLTQSGIDACIINYVPSKTSLRTNLSLLLHGNVKKILYSSSKNKLIDEFRKKHFKYSKKKYTSYNQLKNCEKLDIIFTGSDQIWNPSFTMTGEGKVTLSYFAAFSNAKKIAYAASFGTNKLTENMKAVVEKPLSEYSAISVREKSGVGIINDLSLSAEIVCDPTILLSSTDYEKIIDSSQINHKYQIFNYILNSDWSISRETNNYISSTVFKEKTKLDNTLISVSEWLYNVKNSDFVVTDSFHGTVFSILFHKPFLSIVNMENPMNDRITTLLSSLGLENRMITRFNEDSIDKIISEDIDWKNVEKNLSDYRKHSIDFISRSIKVCYED